MVQAAEYLNSRPLLIAAVLRNQNLLLNDKNMPSDGPANAKVIIVEFFDYQCVYCARMSEELDNIKKANPQVRIVFRAWPVLKRRWNSSLSAACTGQQVWQQKGRDAWLTWHHGLFATGLNEGRLTTEDIRLVAGAVRFDAANAPCADGDLQSTDALAGQLGLTGTPALIVLPARGASEHNLTVLPGFAETGVRQAAVNKAMPASESPTADNGINGPQATAGKLPHAPDPA